MSTDPRFVAQMNEYLRGKDPKLKEVVQGLRALVKQAVPEVTESVNPWGVPTFEFDGPLCYFMVAKHHVTFGFHRGTSLADPKGLLEGTGKNLRHVKVRAVEELGQKGLRELVAAAAHLNCEEPLPGMNRVGK